MEFKVTDRTPEERVKSYHRLHYTWVDKAIKADEENDVQTAVQCYIKGLECSNMCLKELIIGNNHTQIRARDIQDKMRKNRDSEIERLEFLLSSKLKSDRAEKFGMKKSSSMEFDQSDFIKPKTFNKSLRDKKSKKEVHDRNSKNITSNESGDMGNRSQSATCLNKINSNSSYPEGNLAKALRSINSPQSTSKPTGNTATTINKPIPGYNCNRITSGKNNTSIPAKRCSASGPPRPKLTTAYSLGNDKASDSTTIGDRKIDKNGIMSKLKNVDKQCVETIINEVLDSKVVKFEDVSGHDLAKQCLLETVIYPQLRPELFTGLRSPAKGILLFGPPGNGKTLLAKAVANESKCVFFNISAASLMSKWVGEGEKMVRALFAVAKYVAPSVIFLDEVDSLLSSRNSDDKSVTRRMLTQFLQEIDGAASNDSERVLCMAATNRPDELDDAALRRFQKKIYIGMPDNSSRKNLIKMLLKNQANKLKESDINKLVEMTKGYSASDLTNLAKCAAMAPIRELSFDKICSVTVDSMRPIKYSDFDLALKQIKSSVPPHSLVKYEKWNVQFGDTS